MYEMHRHTDCGCCNGSGRKGCKQPNDGGSGRRWEDRHRDRHHPLYGGVTLTWPADANIAGGLRPDSPYWVPGINPDGSMALSTAAEFVDKLNQNEYLGITTWSLPITIFDDRAARSTIRR